MRLKESPPTRVVWIEIPSRKGIWLSEMLSPPTRVVWIEIVFLNYICNPAHVTTHTGGVD